TMEEGRKIHAVSNQVYPCGGLGSSVLVTQSEGFHLWRPGVVRSRASQRFGCRSFVGLGPLAAGSRRCRFGLRSWQWPLGGGNASAGEIGCRLPRPQVFPVGPAVLG